ncbi:MAG: DNA mismatch repair endonuclease MutL [Candidatus Muiribacteriota bacterium]
MILKLPEEISAKIAAGEVIHKPHSVVKELVENSIDAGADKIDIEIKDGGKKQITVTDNGSGMSMEELKICFHKYTTSKISKLDDLEKINTLGFRGEALHSISAVSRMEISTREKKYAYGYKAKIDGFKIKKLQKTAKNCGTKIDVKNLFFNLPVRLKFLKNSAAEARRISEVVIRYILAFPNIKFKFISNNKEIFNTPGNSDMLQAIGEIYGNLYVKNMLFLKKERPGLKLEGYISNLNISKSNSKFQYVFLNGRYIKNNTVSYAVAQSYRDYYRDKKYPVFFLCLYVNPERFDVNVHPSKEEVKFLNEQEIFSFVFSSVSTLLKEAVKSSDYDFLQKKSQPVNNSENASDYSEGKNKYFQTGLNEKSPEFKKNVQTELALAFNEKKEKIESEQNNFKNKFSSKKILSQLKNTFILVETNEDLMIIDQHVAHERVLYEKYMTKLCSSNINRQKILFPLNIELKPYEASMLEQRLHIFEKLGFLLEKFGETMFVVKEIPAFMTKMEDNTVKDIIDEIFTSSYIKNHTDLREEIIINASCKNAIKAGTPLSFEEMQLLVDSLFKTENPYVCPHGRPVIVKFDFKSLYSKFGRNQ